MAATTSATAISTTRTLAGAWEASRNRGNNFDAIRLLAASLVILSHSFLLTDGDQSDDPLHLLTGELYTGEIGVLIFFAASGFLITRSWQSAPNVEEFVKKRALRILPALVAVVLVLAFVIGPLLTTLSAAAYFSSPQMWLYLSNIGLVTTFDTLPGVFEHLPFGAEANGPLWTLAFEATCYAIVAILGRLRLLSPLACIVIYVALLLLHSFPQVREMSAVGSFAYRMSFVAPTFIAGSIAALLAHRIPLDARLAAIAAAGLVIAGAAQGLLFAFSILGTYLVLYVAFAPFGAVRHAAKYGDFSYGLYLWGWPIQQIAVGAGLSSFWLTNFLVSAPLALAAAVLSWKLVEAPALALKRGKLIPRYRTP